MAAIDFPSSPTVGQTFTAGNGVTYVWNGTLWLATGASTGGDFCARRASYTTTAGAVVITNYSSIISGNSGGWFNSTTGVFTPPAGRFHIFASVEGYASGAQTNIGISIRKNGVTVLSGVGSTGSTWWISPQAEGTIDANGTDAFTIIIDGAPTAGALCSEIIFGAYPISGIKGPPGDPHGYLGGDFMAFGTGGSLSGSLLVLKPATISVGNASGSYSSSTGLFTPPAGRYELFGIMNGSVTAAGHAYLNLYKNGVAISGLGSVIYAGAAGAALAVDIQGIVDANGTDSFDLRTYAGVAGSISSFVFGAYPISGIKGPPGDPGVGVGSAFSAQLTSNQAVGASSTVTVQNYSELYDNENTFNPTTGVWTPTTGGVYRINGFTSVSAGAACSLQFMLRNITAASDIAGADSTIAGASFSINMSFNYMVRVTAGNAHDLRVRTVSPVAATILASGAFTGFNATYVAP